MIAVYFKGELARLLNKSFIYRIFNNCGSAVQVHEWTNNLVELTIREATIKHINFATFYVVHPILILQSYC